MKCQLLVACYAETFDNELAKEAHEIINGWEGRDLTLAEREVFDYLESLEANPYPNWEVAVSYTHLDVYKRQTLACLK